MITKENPVITNWIFAEIRASLVDSWVVSPLKRYNLLSSRINAKILVLGITFKENCPDVRNTRVVDVIKSLREYSTEITVMDPWANEEEVLSEYQIISTQSLPEEQFDAIVLAVAHEEFRFLNYQKLRKSNSVIYDVKSILANGIADKTL